MQEIKRTICDICASRCPMDCYIEDGRIVSVEPGQKGSGASGLCSKGAAALQYVYNKERLRYPMVRTGEKGSGRFERITWDEAYDLMAEKLLRIRESHGPESVVFYAGYPKWYRPALLRFANAFGSPNFCTESSTCFQAFALSWALTFGGSPAMPDLKNCRTLMLWSRNLFHSDVGAGVMLRKLRERGGKVIDVDPANTVTAHESDIHLDPLPGTDGALALGMANVILSEGLWDREFVEKYVSGFGEFRAYAASFTPERVEQITGVKKELVVEAARIYALNKPSAIMFSASPVVHNINGLQNYRAVEALIAITGNYDVPGGNCLRARASAPLNEFGRVLRLTEPEAIGQREFPAWFDCPCQEAQCTRLAHYIQSEEPYPIKGLFAMGMNHRMWPKPSHLERALGKLDFYVDSDLFITDSMKTADLILPAQSFFEHDEIINPMDGRVILREAVIPPEGEAENDIVMIQRLMQRMGLSDPVLSGSYEDYMNQILLPSGLQVSNLRGHPEGLYSEETGSPEYRSFEKKPFNTPSGKIELASEVLKRYEKSHGYHALPVYQDFREHIPEACLLGKEREAFLSEYPLILNAGSRRPQFFHSRTYRMAWLRNLEEAALLEMHPSDAGAREIHDGDPVQVVSSCGSISAVAELNPSCHPGVVRFYHGNPQADVNELIPEEYLDPVSGFPGFKSWFCEVKRYA